MLKIIIELNSSGREVKIKTHEDCAGDGQKDEKATVHFFDLKVCCYITCCVAALKALLMWPLIKMSLTTLVWKVSVSLG